MHAPRLLLAAALTAVVAAVPAAVPAATAGSTDHGRTTVAAAPARPGPPTNVRATVDGPGAVELDWQGPKNRGGSKVTGYVITWSQGGGGEVVLRRAITRLVLGRLRNGVTYTFRIATVTKAGRSVPSKPSNPARPDALPAAPTTPDVVWGDRELRVSWTQPRYEGSPVETYEIDFGKGTTTVPGGKLSVRLTGLENGAEYRVRVRGINSAKERSFEGTIGASKWSDVTPGRPSGSPARMAAPTVRVLRPEAGTGDPARALVRWAAPDNNGWPISKYQVRLADDGALVCRPPKEARTCEVDLAAGRSYAFEVRAFNRDKPRTGVTGWSDWSAASEPVTAG